MLSSDISSALTQGQSATAIATQFAQMLSADTSLLRSELQGNGPLSRKRFCEFIGVGESTLTGWLQADRIPQTAAVAYVLLLVAEALRNQVSVLQGKEREPKIIALGGKYAVARFDETEDGGSMGRIVASDIDHLQEARQIAFSQSEDLPRLLARHLELVDDLIELTEGAGNDTPHRMAALNAERAEFQRRQRLVNSAHGAQSKKPSRPD